MIHTEQHYLLVWLYLHSIKTFFIIFLLKKTAVDCIHNTNNFLFADGKLRKVKPGDCMVAFSQRDLYQLRREIEKKSKEKCAIIYGSLPPGKASTS